MFQFDPTIGMSLLFSVAVVVFTWFRTRRHNVDDRFGKVDDRFVKVDGGFKKGSDRMDVHAQRLAALEQDMKSRPGINEVHELQIQLVEMAGSLKEMHAVMEGNSKIMGRLENIVTRHEDHLLGGSK